VAILQIILIVKQKKKAKYYWERKTNMNPVAANVITKDKA
jgi:hypothetical protein